MLIFIIFSVDAYLMSIRPIIIVPHPTLRKKAAEIVNFSHDIVQLAQDMLETMYAAPGIGLAAPQVDVLQRMIVMDVSEDNDHPLVLVNPQIIVAEGEIEGEEGCLSIPSVYGGPIKRAAYIKVQAYTPTAQQIEVEAEGLLSRCIQHEIDHLDGKLFIDYLSPLKRERLLKKMEKLLKEKALDELDQD